MRSRSRGVAVIAAALLAAATAAAAAAVPAASASTQTTDPCGSATTTTVAATDLAVARRIFVGELRGPAVVNDLWRVAHAADLLRAVAARDRSATLAAVKRLVYRPHWHIVRLRVIVGGSVFADVGGPSVIAPLRGVLKVGGRKVGTFVMSIQDDVGYRKLETRFIGVPVELYRDGKRVTGTLANAPSTPPPDASKVSTGGIGYRVASFTATAFPSGPLQVVLFVPSATPSLMLASCPLVVAQETARIAGNIAARFKPFALRYSQFVGAAASFTTAEVLVRVGPLQLAGTLVPGPLNLPDSGLVNYGGTQWAVASVEPTPPARIYVLVPVG